MGTIATIVRHHVTGYTLFMKESTYLLDAVARAPLCIRPEHTFQALRGIIFKSNKLAMGVSMVLSRDLLGSRRQLASVGNGRCPPDLSGIQASSLAIHQFAVLPPKEVDYETMMKSQRYEQTNYITGSLP